MNGQNEQKTHAPISCVLFLAVAAFAVCELVFNMPVSWKPVNDVPAVSVEYHGTDIVLDSDCRYVLVSTYVFSNEGKKPISFDACYEADASYSGTALERTYRNDDSVIEANDEIQPGVTVALQVGHSLDSFMPGKSATVRIRLKERFGELNVIHQTEKTASDIPVKEEKPYCKNC